jgi:hypothetical protein
MNAWMEVLERGIYAKTNTEARKRQLKFLDAG